MEEWTNRVKNGKEGKNLRREDGEERKMERGVERMGVKQVEQKGASGRGEEGE